MDQEGVETVEEFIDACLSIEDLIDIHSPFIRRRNGEEAVRYPNEAIRQVLEKTLGVPLFQGQAMQIAIVAAGFSYNFV